MKNLEIVDNLYAYHIYVYVFWMFVNVLASLGFSIICHLTDLLKFSKCRFLINRRMKDEQVPNCVCRFSHTTLFMVISTLHLEKEDKQIFYWMIKKNYNVWSVLTKNNIVLGSETWP